jgi:hypothetical protein
MVYARLRRGVLTRNGLHSQVERPILNPRDSDYTFFSRQDTTFDSDLCAFFHASSNLHVEVKQWRSGVTVLIFTGPLDMIHNGLRNESPCRFQPHSQLLLDGLQHGRPCRSSILRRRLSRPGGLQRKVPQPC